MIDQLVSAMAREEGWDSPNPGVVPRRLNNPGDLEYAKQLGATPVKVGIHTFARFATPQQGIVGAYRQTLADIAKGWTLRQMIDSWAPPGENDAGRYCASVAESVGIDPDRPLWDYLLLEK